MPSYPNCPVSFIVDGKRVQLQVPPSERLVDTLCDRLKLDNVAWNCRSGECGTCIVRMGGALVCSCLVLTVQARNMRVSTSGHRHHSKSIEHGAVAENTEKKENTDHINGE